MAVTLYQTTITVTPNLPQLTEEINADPTIAPKYVAPEGITYTVPPPPRAIDIDVWMSDALTSGEETALYAVIAAHTPVNPLVDTNVATYVNAGAPTVDDDITQGVLVNDQWIDTTTHTLYVCTDNSEGAAAWIIIPFVSSTAPSDVGTTSVGTGATAARADHVHAHGNQAGGTLHADATHAVDGFLPSTDKEFMNYGFDTVWADGGDLTYGTGLVINVAAGTGFTNDSSDETTGTSPVVWTADTATLTANTLNYIYVTSAGVVSASVTEPSPDSNVLLGTGWGGATAAVGLSHSRSRLQQFRGNIKEWIDHVFGAAAVEGLESTENGTTPLHIDVSAGEFYVSGGERVSPGTTDITWTYWYSNGTEGEWTTVSGVAAVDTTYYDDGTGTLAAMPSNRWKKDLLFIAYNGDGVEYHMVYATRTYTSQQAAEAGSLPVHPEFLRKWTARISGVIVQQGGTAIGSIIDEKATQGQASLGTENPTRIGTRWVPVQSSSSLSESDYGRQIVVPIASNGGGNITFTIPNEAVSLVSAKLYGIISSGAAGSGKNIDLWTDYGNLVSEESPTANQESDTTSTYDFTGRTGLITVVADLVGILTNATGADIVGLEIKHNSIGGPIEYLGVNMVYEVLA